MANVQEVQEKIFDEINDASNKIMLQVQKKQLNRDEYLKKIETRCRKEGLNDEETNDVVYLVDKALWGFGILDDLISDPDISDIRLVSEDCVRIKKNGKRMDAGIAFASEKEYRQFIDYVATRNQVNISNLNAIQRFTDTESHPDFIFRFTLSMPIVNTYSEQYLCIRKVPKNFPMMTELVEKEMLDRSTAELLIERFRQGSTLICGGNSSGKTTLLNALKETLPDDMAILVAQQADELATLFHPDIMFLHSLPGTSESSVSYDLKHISIAGLTMDVDFFIIGEVK